MLLIQHGADPNAEDRNGKTPLFYVGYSEGHLETARLLIENGANVNSKMYKNGQSLLHDAVENGLLEKIKFLIENGADLQAKDYRESTPLHRACCDAQNKFREKEAKLLIQLGADLNAKDMSGRTPLHIACWEGRTDVIRFLLSHGNDASVKTMSNRYETPLELASKGNHLEIVWLLVRQHPSLILE